MTFAPVDRVIYEQNPLAEVICQVRVPRILALDVQVPYEFQAKLKSEYPLLEISNEVALQFAGVGASPTAAPVQRIYAFRTVDKKHHIALSGDFVAVSTSAYEQWQTFRPRIVQMLEAFVACYPPLQPLRVGLRYQDVIAPDRLKLGSKPWSDWIKPAVLGVLATDPWRNATQHLSVTTLKLDDDAGQVTLRQGLTNDVQSPELAYVIDADFSYEPIQENHQNGNIERLLERLDTFNKEAGRLFRLCITDELHRQLRPRSVREIG